MQIDLLGTPQVYKDGQTIDRFISDKARAVLFYVACQREPVARERLLGLIWGDFERKKGLQNLRVTLNNLNKLLGEHIVVTRETVALQAVQVDVRTFEAGEIGRYSGELCAGFGLADSAEFETWLLLERERLGALVRQGLDERVQAARESADLATALTHTRQLVQLDPLDEAHQRTLLELLARQAHYGEALQHGEHLRTLLADELDLPPEPETEELLAHIRRARQLARPNLEPASPLFGRSEDLQSLTRRLSPINPNHERFLTLVGLGGAGKTRLAQAVGARLQTQFFDGVHFIALAAVDRLSGVINALAQALQITPKGKDALQTQVENALHEREVLLIFDNCEQLVANGLGKWVRDLLQRAPRMTLLATSREPLGGETLVPLGGLRDAAADLFLAAVRQLHHNFTPTATDLAAIAQIVEMTAALPLALNLAAAQTDLYTCPQIAAEIASDLDTLATLQRDVPVRQRTIRAVLDYAWRQLSADQQQIVSTLSVLRDPFSAAVSHAIAAATPQQLAQLQRIAVLSERDQLYTIHELLRQFARARAQPAMTKHAAYFANWVAAHEDALMGGEPNSVRGYARQQNDIAAAWRWAVAERDQAQLAQLLRGFAGFHILQNLRDTLREALQAALAVATERVLIGRIQTHLAAIEHIELNIPPARQLILQACENLAAQPRWLAYALKRRAAIELDEGQTATAAELLDAAIAHFRASGDRMGEARALIDIGLARSRLGEVEINWIEQSLTIAEASEDWRTQLRCNIVLGNGCIGRGAYDQAVGYYDSAETIAQQLNDQRNLASCAVNRGLALQMLSHYDAAEAANQRAHAIFEQIHDRDGICFALKNLSTLAYLQGEFAAAERFLRRALAMRRMMSGRLQGWLEQYLLGIVAFAQDKRHAGAQYVVTALRRLVEANYEAAILYSVEGIAQALLTYGHVETAVALLVHAIAQPSMEANQRHECEKLLVTLPDEVAQVVENRSTMALAVEAVNLLADVPDCS